MAKLTKAKKAVEEIESDKQKPIAKKFIFLDRQLEDIDNILIEELRLIDRNGDVVIEDN